MSSIDVGDFNPDREERLQNLTRELVSALVQEMNLKRQLREVGQVVDRTMKRLNEIREGK